MLSPPRFRGLQKISDLPLISCDKNVNNQDSAKADKQRKQCPISFISKTERPCPKRLDWWRYLFNSLPRIRQKLHWWNETHICFATRIKNTRKHKSALAERSCPGKLLAVRLIVLATALGLKKKKLTCIWFVTAPTSAALWSLMCNGWTKKVLSDCPLWANSDMFVNKHTTRRRTIVIMNKCDKILEAQTQLNTTEHYKPLRQQ